MNRKIVLVLFPVLFTIVAFILIGYPYLLKNSITEPQFNIDEKEGKAWLDTQIVMEFRGNHSKGAILESLQISPKVKIGEDDLRVERIARFPWHKGFPWAKTRVTINPERIELFAPEASYTVSIRDEELKFETITLPRVIETGLADGSEAVSIHESLRLRFNEAIDWDNKWLVIDPAEEVVAKTEDVMVRADKVETILFILPKGKPWKNSTTYAVTIRKGLLDKFGHQMREDFVFSFATELPVSVVDATPSGKSQKPDSVVKMVFDRAPLPEAAENSFLVIPKVEGKFIWEDETTLVWTPAQKLPYSTEYVLAIGGEASRQDPIKAHEWKFRTVDPPVFVEIQGGSNSPATLEAVGSGGIGSYSYRWSTGETSESISVEVSAGETWAVSVTVSSGDQTATAEVLVKGPPLPPPPPAPAPEPPPPAPAPPPVTPGKGMKFVLSFDDSDGSGAIVSGILDTLARYGAKAIFFPTGSWAAGAGAPYVRRMLAEGHMVCNHTRDHADLTILSEAGIREQILGGAGVGTCNLLRPPYGAHNAFVDSVAASMGYSVYMWTVDPRDWSGTSASYITSTILNNASPGGIVVLHMHAYNTLLALPAVIEGLQAAGYTVSY